MNTIEILIKLVKISLEWSNNQQLIKKKIVKYVEI